VLEVAFVERHHLAGPKGRGPAQDSGAPLDQTLPHELVRAVALGEFLNLGLVPVAAALDEENAVARLD
jgi:hypothetical protein